MDELRPCPFCGGGAVAVAYSSCSGVISCCGCEMETKKFWDEPMTANEGERKKWYEIAKEAWDRREGGK